MCIISAVSKNNQNLKACQINKLEKKSHEVYTNIRKTEAIGCNKNASYNITDV